MKLKILILMILMIISINNVSCNDEVGSGFFEFSGTSISEFSPSYDMAGTDTMRSIYFTDIAVLHDIKRIQMSIPRDEWNGGSLISQWEDIEFRAGSSGGSLISTGVYGYSVTPTMVYPTIYFDEPITGSGSAVLAMTISLSLNTNINVKGNRQSSISDEINQNNPPKSTDALLCKAGTPNYILSSTSQNIYTDTYYDMFFYTSYNWTKNTTLERLKYNQFRDAANKTKTKITINNTVYHNDTTFQSTELNYLHYTYDIENLWNINIENEYGTTKNFNINFNISDIIEPTLTTDKTYYNTSEQITISYTNIDKIYDECTSSLCDGPYQMWVYAIDPIEDIPKYRSWLYSDRRDETFVLNTSFLLPQTTYKLVITSGETNVMIESDVFYIYPDDEYLSVSCGTENNCYTYNNADVTIYYKINNNSDIIIKDNNNNVINTYHNIIDNGEILYHIPDDLNHINTYPNWKVYLNNTGYSTSFNKGITVYWSQFQTPTPTSTYTPSPTPDINISDTIDEFKTETQPIKDLIFGLSEIVIDNPDYNKDNIVDENEINHWFNSLIPICIIFLLVVLYIGLKKQRD